MPRSSPPLLPEPVEFSVEEAMLDAWEEDSGVYLRLDARTTIPAEPPSQDES